MPKLLIIIVAGFLMFAGATVSIMQQMELGPFAPDEDAAAGQPGAATRPPSKTQEPPKFVTMDPLVVPVIQGNRVAATIQIQLQLETSEDKMTLLKKMMPRLKDAYIRDLHNYIPRLLRGKKELDLAMLKQRLVIIGERAIGKGLMSDVLIQSVLDRPTR
jgi:flagellar basal body-associated protein FliL